MGEKTDFVFFFENREWLPPRRFLIERILSSWPDWFNSPTELLLLNYETSEQVVEAWENSNLIAAPLRETDILTVYTSLLGVNNISGILSVSEREKVAAYTLSIEKTVLLSSSIGFIEDKVTALFEMVTAFYPPVLFAGSEVEWDESLQTASQVVNNAMDLTNESYWVMAGNTYLCSIPDEFEVARQLKGFCLLRRRDILVASGFSE